MKTNFYQNVYILIIKIKTYSHRKLQVGELLQQKKKKLRIQSHFLEQEYIAIY